MCGPPDEEVFVCPDKMPRRARPLRRADPTAQAQRRGLRDYATAEDGGEPVHIRTYDPVNDRFKYTAAGKRLIPWTTFRSSQCGWRP